MDIIILIIVGALIGLLGKFVAPGDKDNIPIWLTILCGIGGVVLGNYIYAAFSRRRQRWSGLGPLDRCGPHRCGAGGHRLHGHRSQRR